MLRSCGCILLAVLMFLPWAVPSASGRDTACIQQVAAEDLDGRLGTSGSAVIEAGESVTLHLFRGRTENRLAGPPGAWMSISVREKGASVRELPDSYYLGYAQLTSGTVSFWMIGEYTGGAHCCARYHFFAQSSPEKPLRYLGATEGSSAGLDEKPFACRNGSTYLKDEDLRFQYFHTPYALSILTIPTHYRLSGEALAVDNSPFRQEYLEAAQAIDDELSQSLRQRVEKPESILRNDGTDFFSDEPGQLLVKRTILYLYAREERNAWLLFNRDVRRHYGTEQHLEQLKSEIGKILKGSRY